MAALGSPAAIAAAVCNAVGPSGLARPVEVAVVARGGVFFGDEVRARPLPFFLVSSRSHVIFLYFDIEYLLLLV